MKKIYPNFFLIKYIHKNVITIKFYTIKKFSIIVEIRATYREMMETMKKSSKEEINEETKKSFIKHGHFLKCMLESKDMVTIAFAFFIINISTKS